MSRISRFSPNWSNPETLEAITVAREAFIAGAVESARESALTKNKHHRLFIGPNGSGKTHLVTLVRHRLLQIDDLNDVLRIAWLNEDETCNTLLSLLLRVYRSLSREYPAEFPADLAEAVFDLEDIQEATLAITKLLLKQLQNKTVLLLIENLDTIFHTFGEAEQKSWRALMQNHPQFCTIATAQRLFQGVSSRRAPFFGLFQIKHLQPFSVSEATELFTKIAELRKDEELQQFVRSFQGRARIRALHHLAGGNQRLFIILSEFIDRKSLDSLVEPLEKLVDEQLTPYYQERLRWLSPLQRRIVEYLCTVTKPQTVKAIARRLFSTSQTISKQLQKLRKLGYVISRSRGRESLYELAEPLMRLSYQVKEARGRTPLRLLVDFLGVWYNHRELLEKMQLAGTETYLNLNYLSAAIALHELEGNLRLNYLQDGINPMNCSDDEIELLRDLMEDSKDPKDFLRYGIAQGNRKNHKEALNAFKHVISMDKVPVNLLASALIFRAATFLELGSINEAIKDCKAIVDLGNVENPNLTFAHLLLANLLIFQSDWTEASHYLNKGLNLCEHQTDVIVFAILEYIFTLLGFARKREFWEFGITLLVDIFIENSGINLLPQGIIDSISLLRGSSLSAEKLSEWCSLWENQAQKHQELELPVRLLRTGVDYFVAGEDASVLLELPQEERRILAQVLGLEAEKSE
jgi:tetratricopeptide (TPR) repeat protein